MRSSGHARDRLPAVVKPIESMAVGRRQQGVRLVTWLQQRRTRHDVAGTDAGSMSETRAAVHSVVNRAVSGFTFMQGRVYARSHSGQKRMQPPLEGNIGIRQLLFHGQTPSRRATHDAIDLEGHRGGVQAYGSRGREPILWRPISELSIRLRVRVPGGKFPLSHRNGQKWRALIVSPPIILGVDALSGR